MKKLPVLILVFVLAVFVFPLACFANAAAPPSVIIIVPGAPDDLTMILQPGDIQPVRADKVLETYFNFYDYDLQSADYTLEITTGGSTFSVALDAPHKFNNIYTLDLKNQTVILGESFTRSFNLTTLRIVLTLVIEGLIFFLFGYRTRRSWLVFIIANLVTQGLLNVWLTVSTTPMQSYMILNLVWGEFLVFIAETAVFLIFVNERRRRWTFLYVVVANLVSLFLGGWLITCLPV